MFDQETEMQPEGETERLEDDRLFCAACRHPVTRARHAFDFQGGHERVFFNPAGVVYRVLLFTEAEGANGTGQPTDDFTWFKGYDWVFAVCGGCGAHLGWQYLGEGQPSTFFGIIKGKLSSDPG